MARHGSPSGACRVSPIRPDPTGPAGLATPTPRALHTDIAIKVSRGHFYTSLRQKPHMEAARKWAWRRGVAAWTMASPRPDRPDPASPAAPRHGTATAAGFAQASPGPACCCKVCVALYVQWPGVMGRRDLGRATRRVNRRATRPHRACSPGGGVVRPARAGLHPAIEAWLIDDIATNRHSQSATVNSLHLAGRTPRAVCCARLHAKLLQRARRRARPAPRRRRLAEHEPSPITSYLLSCNTADPHSFVSDRGRRSALVARIRRAQPFFRAIGR